VTTPETSVYWLNFNYVDAGVWTNNPQSTLSVSRGSGVVQQVGGADIEILEVRISGGATLAVPSDTGANLAAFGGPNVWLLIKYTSGREEYRSGPSDRPYALSQVAEFTLNYDVLVGNAAYEQVQYSIELIGHCQWAGPANVVNPPPNA
jgi:hypothetical protein